MTRIAATPQPPYYAVIFTSIRTHVDEGYVETNQKLEALLETQPGFLGFESVREDKSGITVSYWENLDVIKQWKQQADHKAAQQQGRKKWYEAYKIRICKVEKDYGVLM